MDSRFYKIHVGGNHFVVLDARSNFDYDFKDFTLKFLHPKFGLAADGVLFIVNSTFGDVGVRYFNNDGSEAYCANGIRAAIHYMKAEKLLPSSTESIEVETISGNFGVSLKKISLKTPKPTFFDSPYGLDTVSVTLGNPNAVIFVDDLSKVDVQKEGAEISAKYPQGANVIFAQRENEHEASAKFWERGVGETLSCGSGICALLAAGKQTGMLTSPVTVKTAGGQFQVAGSEQFELRGPVTEVAKGTLCVDSITRFYEELENPERNSLI